MRDITVPIEILTTSNFEPFGQVIETNQKGDVYDDHPTRMKDLGFEVDGNPALFIVRFVRQAIIISQMERHLTMTESRVSLGEPVIILVAPTLPEDDTLPAAQESRAFLIGPNQGLSFHRGTWHSLDCYPIASAWADFVLFTEREAEVDLLRPDLSQCSRTNIIDLEKRLQLRLVVSDPLGLIGSR